MEKKGNFEIVAWLHSHYATGAEEGYSISSFSGNNIYLEMIDPLIKGGNSGKPFGSFFDGWCDEYEDRQTDTWYKFSCSWAFDDGDPSVGLPAGYGIWIDAMEAIE